MVKDPRRQANKGKKRQLVMRRRIVVTSRYVCSECEATANLTPSNAPEIPTVYRIVDTALAQDGWSRTARRRMIAELRKLPADVCA